MDHDPGHATEEGWRWLTGAAERGGPTDDPAVALARVFARCFAGPDGARVLAHLRRITVERCLAPDAPAAVLRHLEGQRALVHHIAALIARGQGHTMPSAVITEE